jgi:hypothetical protein
MALIIRKYCAIRDARISVDGKAVFSYEGQDGFKKFIRAAYKHYQTDYPKFFKMDNLSKLGFFSVEVLLKGEDILKLHPAEKTGIILTNASSSLEIDEKHFESIKTAGNIFRALPTLYTHCQILWQVKLPSGIRSKGRTQY